MILLLSNSFTSNLYINLACLSVCLFVCLFVSNKRQNGWTDRAQIFCGTSRDPREGLWMIKIQIFVSIKIRSSLNFFKFWKSTKFFVKIRELFFVLFYDVHKENMFTINLENGREAPLRLKYIYLYIWTKIFII